MAYFSPSYLSSLIVQPLRYYYSNFSTPELVWNKDPKLSTIEIDTINNFNKIAIQNKSRILISRGGYVFKSTGLSDNIVQGSGSRDTGIKSEKKMLLVEGQAQILIEARNEGTCEKVLELTQNFITRSAQTIANTQDFKQFALPLSVSPCTPSKEDTEVFSSTINLPWSKETHWLVEEDGIVFKQFLLTMVSS